MARLTVCIPSYRADAFIHHTLASVRDQTFADFRVEIGVEPVDAERTLSACAPFLEDPRFHIVVNPEVLGYSGNVQALLHRVEAPLFAVLPHDDAWHPRFLERLLDVLSQRPDAVCAYPDLYCFAQDGLGAGVVSHEISDSELPERVVSWFIDGATGNIWHGLTRSEVLAREFPDNQYRGFAVECEWALHLLSQGRVVRAAEPLYLKRQPASGTPDSVSASWFAAEQELPDALEHHRRRLLSLIPETLSIDDREVARWAAEAAMLRRQQEFADRRWGLTRDGEQRAAEVLEAAQGLESSVGARIASSVRWALSRHWEARGDQEAAESEARRGLAASPDSAMLGTQLGWLLIGRGDDMEAMTMALRASRAHPDDPGVRLLLRYCEGRLEQSLRPLAQPSEGHGSLVPDPSASLEAASEADPPESDVDHLDGDMAHLMEADRHVKSRVATVGLARSTMNARDWRHVKRMIALARRVVVRLGGPNPLFDAEWYRMSYPDVPARPISPWLHWRRVGRREGRNPNPFFDTRWYLARNPDVQACGMDPLAHYLLDGAAEGHNPGPGFDARAYLRRNPDVRISGINPLLHYQRHGALERRLVSPVREPGCGPER